MSSKYIEKVAIIGASGHVGRHFVDELLKTGKQTITAVSRSDSTASFQAGVNVARVDYSDPSTLVSALRGHQFLIITLSVRAPPGLHTTIVKAAIEAGVSYIMPNCYGYDYRSEKLRSEEMSTAGTYKNVMEVQELGGNYVAMVCGFWYEWSLALGEQWYGFEINNRKVTFFDDGNTKVQTSTWNQCGRALAALLSLPTEKGNQEGPALEQWKNQALLIQSFCISQRDTLDSLHRVLGTKDEDWEIKFESTEKRVKDGKEELKAGDFRGFAKSLYSRIFFPNGDSKFLGEVVNDVLGLPKEDLDEATKRAVDMAKSGFSLTI